MLFGSLIKSIERHPMEASDAGAELELSDLSVEGLYNIAIEHYQLVLRSSQMIHLIFEMPEVGGGIGPVGVESSV